LITEFARLEKAVENSSTRREYLTFWDATFANSDDIEAMTEDRATRLLMEWSDQPMLVNSEH